MKCASLVVALALLCAGYVSAERPLHSTNKDTGWTLVTIVYIHGQASTRIPIRDDRHRQARGQSEPVIYGPFFVPSMGKGLEVAQNTFKGSDSWNGWSWVGPRGVGTQPRHGEYLLTPTRRNGVSGFLITIKSWDDHPTRWAIWR